MFAIVMAPKEITGICYSIHDQGRIRTWEGGGGGENYGLAYSVQIKA